MKQEVHVAKLTIQQLGELLRKQRGGRGIREAATEIGISPATLSRVERGNVPDLDTFGKICRWLHLDPGSVLGVETSDQTMNMSPRYATAHYKADQTISPELANALAQMILRGQDMLKES